MPAPDRSSTDTVAADVLIVGGGVIGSAIAYFLAADPGFDGKVVVLERDPTYAACSTSRSVGAFRQQFSTPENIAMSQFGARFFRSAHETLRVGEDVPELSLHEPGYLFLATEAGLAVMRENHRTQRAVGVAVRLLAPEQIHRRFRWMNVADLAGGSLGLEGEGWLDPHALMLAFRARAISLGARFLAEEVVAVHTSGDRVRGVLTRSGGRFACGWLVNAAGAHAARVAALAGVADLPVHPRKRIVYTIQCRSSIQPCPLVVDPTGVWFRPESEHRFLCGVSPPPDRDPDCLDLDVETDWFDQVVWPAQAHRVPAFDAVRRINAWAGHYAVNLHDRNAVVGPHPRIANLVFANGFSGHGVQQSPAVGRAVAEHIVHGQYRSLDLSRLGYGRLLSGVRICERNVI